MFTLGKFALNYIEDVKNRELHPIVRVRKLFTPGKKLLREK